MREDLTAARTEQLSAELAAVLNAYAELVPHDEVLAEQVREKAHNTLDAVLDHLAAAANARQGVKADSSIITTRETVVAVVNGEETGHYAD